MEYIPPFDAATPLEAYVNRNLGTGTPGSKVPAAFFNVINAELLALITGAGLTPDDGDLTQVFQAVQALAGANDLLIPRGTTMASAATTNIGAGDSDYFEISGTTGITSLGTGTDYNHVWVKFQDALTLTHHATNLILPTGANITTAAGDVAEFVRISGGNWQCLSYTRANGVALRAPLGAKGTTIASAATTDIGAADSSHVEISGTTGISSLGSSVTRDHVWVTFQGALTLSHNGTSLILPTGGNITTAAGDCAEFVRTSGSNWRCVNYMRASGVPVRVPLGAKGTNIASAATTDIGSADSSHVEITGTTGITSLGSGTVRDHAWVTFQGILTLTHHATNLILPTGANITTAAGDCAEFIRTGASSWRCVNYLRANGKQLAAIAAADMPVGSIIQSKVVTYSTNTALATNMPVDDTIPQSSEGTQILSDSLTCLLANSKVRIRFVGFGGVAATSNFAGALFVDAGADAVQATANVSSAGQGVTFGFEHTHTPGDTNAHTYAVRVGGHTQTMRMNGSSAARYFGGISTATMILEEIKQ